MENILQSSDQKKGILIVDDNPQNLQVLGKYLKEKDYEIEFAINGPDALGWIENKLFDLILLDINMPGMSGFDVCSKIRENHDLNNVPVIFLSADTDRESILKGFELGAQDYITKPFDSRELLVRVQTHITLKDSLEKLARLNRSLEEKVAERTRQLKEANEKLEKTNIKLIGLDKAKSEFLNLISHEIRTPLNGILGPVELLKGPVFASEIGGLIEILDSSVKRLEKFALDALLITRLKTRESDIKHEKISLSDITKEVLNCYSDRLKEKHLKIRDEFHSAHDLVSGEKELILKSVSNILDNALICSPENGAIGIRTSSLNNKIILEITDDGPGFPQGVIEELSELFSHKDKSRDESKGMGLPIVKMIMEAHEGTIELENRPGKGACVKLVFNENSTNN
jgi:two-component system, sensor histidine kinase and response regulator